MARLASAQRDRVTRRVARARAARARSRYAEASARGPDRSWRAESRLRGAGRGRQADGQRKGEGEHDSQHEQQGEAAHHRDRRQHEDPEAGRGRQGPRSRSPGPAAPPPPPPPGAARSPPASPRRSAPGTGSRSRPRDRSAPASTAIDAMVSEPPTSDRKPNVSPDAPSAIPSGRRRIGARNTSARVITMTASAAASRMKICVESSSREPGEDHRHAAHHVARRCGLRATAPREPEGRVGDRVAKQRDRLAGAASREAGPQPDRDQRRVGAGNDRRESGLRHACARARLSQMTDETKLGSSSRGRPSLPVLERRACRICCSNRANTCWPGRGRGRLLRAGRQALLLRLLRGLRAPALRACAVAACDSCAQQLVRLDRELVEEGRRAEDDRARVEPRDRRAGAGAGLAADHLAARRLARETALERQQVTEVAVRRSWRRSPLTRTSTGSSPNGL